MKRTLIDQPQPATSPGGCHLSKVLADFWRRWHTEYLLELREALRHHHMSDVTDIPITVGDIVIIHDENLPRGLWKLGRVEKLMVGTDGKVWCAEVRISASGRSSITMKRPLQRLYPIETGGQVWCKRGTLQKET